METANERGHEGKWVFTLHKPSMIPFLQYAKKRELRRKIYQAYINRGNAYFYTGRVEQAIADYDRAIQRRSAKRHTAYFNRGLANESRKQPDQAFADFVRANEIKPDWVLAAGRVEHYRKQGYPLSH